MARRTMASYHVLRRILSPRFFLVLACVTFIPLIWTNLANRDENIVQEALDNVARDIRYADVYRKANRQPKSLKYILLWTSPDYSPFYFFGSGQRAFLKNNCSVINCYVTANKNFFGGNIKKFDAVAFNGRNMKYMRRSQLPEERSSHQKYIFFNLESADNYPLCQNMFDGFFNWTSTYRLDSDVPYPYIVVKNKNGDIVGPKLDMVWDKMDGGKVDEELLHKLQKKKKAAAWFVSNCSDRSGRRAFVENLEKALASYGLVVDIYGSCGILKCPIGNNECDLKVERDYYFYLALENSFAPDYVTEKLLFALQHDTVPIVYGAADYSRFLPPGSYLDARKQSPEDLASEMARIISSPKTYQQFFKWKRYYDFFDATALDNVCSVCAALNNKTFVETESTYKEFRRWWNSQYDDRCWWMDYDSGMRNLWP